MHNSTKVRVGYISPGWPLASYPSGIVAYVENIVTAMHEIADPIVLSFGMDEPEEEGRTVNIAKYDNYTNLPAEMLIKVLSRLGFSNVEAMRYQHFLKSSAHIYKNTLKNLKEPLDIVEMEESLGATYYATNQTKARFVTRLHGPWFIMEKLTNLEATEQSKLRIFYEGEAIKRAHGVTSPSLDVLEKVKEFYNIELPHAKVIPNPVALVPKNKQWRLANKNAYMLFVGRFDSVKGGDLIIDSFNIVAQADKDIELYFVGPDRGYTVDGVELSIDEYIARNVRNESIRKRIKFLGHCDSEQISTLRQKARVTVCCSRYESFSLSLLEALSAGCPTVATAVGGMKEIITDNHNGLFAEPKSIGSIAEKVLTLLNDNDKSKILSENALKDIKKRFSSKDIAHHSLKYYQSVLNHY